MFEETNAARRAAALPALGRSMNLMSAAQMQADQMAQANTMAHDIPSAAYPTLQSRMDAVSYPYRAVGENVAEGYQGGAGVVQGWMRSPGHRANILSAEYTELGTGAARARNGRAYYAQVFGRPR
jgi:uncharacterized protein YkwD